MRAQPERLGDLDLVLRSLVAVGGFSPFGTYMAITFRSEVDIWNATTRAFVSRHNTTAIPGATSAAYAISVAFSASGAALISGEDTCGKIAYCAD